MDTELLTTISVLTLCQVFCSTLSQSTYGNQRDTETFAFGSARSAQLPPAQQWTNQDNAPAGYVNGVNSYSTNSLDETPDGDGPSIVDEEEASYQFGVDDNLNNQRTLVREKHFGQPAVNGLDQRVPLEESLPGAIDTPMRNYIPNQRNVQPHRPQGFNPNPAADGRFRGAPRSPNVNTGNDAHAFRGPSQQVNRNDAYSQQVVRDPEQLQQLMIRAQAAEQNELFQGARNIPPGSSLAVQGPGWTSLDVPMKPHVPVPDGIQDQNMNPNYKRYFGELDDQIAFELPELHVNCWLQAMMSSVWGFSPSCNHDGTYGPKQCHQKRCWCVNHSGVKIKHHGGKRDDGFYYGLRGLTLFCSEN